MKSFVITGGLGCGKSRVLEEFIRFFGGSADRFSADESVAVHLNNASVLRQMTDSFGMAAVLAPGELNRAWMREHVLAEPVLRKKMEAILHPLVLRSLEMAREGARASGKNLFLAEVPLHYEIDSTVSADFVIVVASSRSVQVRRMMETRALDEQTVHKFLEAQWPIEAKVERADAVIWNDGGLASLEDQVLTLASNLLQA